ncbi:MAG: BON domain-containing protein [Armatimonadota bacterium]|nr:BON domain-containing protein [Armatimonadota bacterium]
MQSNDPKLPEVTSIAAPSAHEPEIKEPIIITAEEEPTALAIRDSLITEPKLGGADIEIRIDEGKVILSGKVISEEQKNLIIKTTRRFIGYKHLVDELKIAQ